MHCKLVQQRLLVGVHEVIAPLDERPQPGAANVRCAPIAHLRKPARDQRQELGEPEMVDARGGKLDRER